MRRAHWSSSRRHLRATLLQLASFSTASKIQVSFPAFRIASSCQSAGGHLRNASWSIPPLPLLANAQPCLPLPIYAFPSFNSALTPIPVVHMMESFPVAGFMYGLKHESKQKELHECLGQIRDPRGMRISIWDIFIYTKVALRQPHKDYP